ncbi:uncharacterized protein zgc:113184 [Pleuronectes platessa]|uniref:uncharacterized protein zgc:113184 n=1 Tax=Pleuronectes platessa TaxID=8262 RepID=UPI00232A0F11|nr:uncharacterized protein zgc:113184 [Pleuronectes platessa]XP_053300642.1 uncharacterized protein zgc:113184 [Pleuronectes platessa]XP_053300651.1 uncharacterized protein zgc:113184 [Pleuronectes platessa]XP_053300662.1 uncharacterized protein zgc:113184 [Pleuronectes platessa]
MEEAYSELYQQFLRLRSLCLRQAALLHQLTTALQKQQGATVPNGELSYMLSIPFQGSQAIPVLIPEKLQPMKEAPKCCDHQVSRNVYTFSDLLVEDMSKLCMDLPLRSEEDGKLEPKVAPLSTVDPSRPHGALSGESKTPGQADHRGRDRTVLTPRFPASDRGSRVMDFMSQPGGLLMSDVALHSHVCDFCQAVFPGDTTTKGEFIRHLHTHIS